MQIRGSAKAVFPDLGEEVAEGFAAGFYVGRGGGAGLRGERSRDELQGAEGDKKKLGEDGSELAQFHSRVQGTGCRVPVAAISDRERRGTSLGF